MKTSPISIVASKAYSQTFSDLSVNDIVSRNNDSLELNYDLNIWKRDNQNRQNRLLIEQLQIELEHVRIQEKVTIYEALIEYLMGRQLQQFLETEKALYLQKREFF